MGSHEGVKLPKYVTTDKQRDGRARWIFRRKGFPKVTLPEPGSKGFWEAYGAAISGFRPEKRSAKVRVEGTFGWLCDEYMKSAEFCANDELSQKQERRIFQGMRDEPIVPGSLLKMEECPLTSLNETHVIGLRDRKQDAPFMANRRLNNLRRLIAWAFTRKHMHGVNFARDVGRLKQPKGGFYTWTEEDVTQYEEAHAIGTKPRLALALMLYTGFRISDACQLGPQHVKNTKDGVWIKKPQHKNRRRQGKIINVPMLSALQEIIDATPTGAESFLLAARGKPYTTKAAADTFKEWCRRAGLPHCSAHGVRKAGAVNAAYNGATESQLKAMFGWESSKEVETYTKEAERRRLAGQAMGLIVNKGTV
jgi:integrase